MKKIIYMPHAGHFILGHRCAFKLNTYVNGYIISTVGELLNNDWKYENIGFENKYETMVFNAIPSGEICCPYIQKNGSELDCKKYNDPASAYIGHNEMIEKYKKINTN